MSVLERIRRWWRPERRCILRELVDAKAFADNPASALLEAALLVQRARLTVDGAELERAEVEALGRAQELLEAEHAWLFAQALRKPHDVSAVYDGGAARRSAVMDEAMRLATKGVL